MNRLILMIILFTAFAFHTEKTMAQTTWKAPKEADKLINPLTGDENATKKGKKTYKQLCMICHGPKGKGDGAAGAALNPKPANFTSDAVQNQTDGALFWKLTNGKAPMAAYKDLLTETQRWELINYIRTLKQ